MTQVLCLLAAFGLAFVWLHKLPRGFFPFFRQCVFCAGGWAGMLVWFLTWVANGQPIFLTTTADRPYYLPVALGMILWTFASATFTYALDTLIMHWEMTDGSPH